MRNIIKRVEGLEHRHGRGTATGRKARVSAGMDALMTDDAGRDAALDLVRYLDRRHPGWPADRAALRADPRVEELVGAVTAQATRLNAAWWLEAAAG